MLSDESGDLITYTLVVADWLYDIKPHRYNESTSTLLRLSVLEAWAEVYVRAHEINAQDNAEEALDLLSTVSISVWNAAETFF